MNDGTPSQRHKTLESGFSLTSILSPKRSSEDNIILFRKYSGGIIFLDKKAEISSKLL